MRNTSSSSSLQTSTTTSSGMSKVWPTILSKSSSPTVCVWGGILRYGMCSLLEYEGMINAINYQDMLAQALSLIEQLFDGHHLFFQQDGESAHRASSSTVFLEENIVPSFISKEHCQPTHQTSPIKNLWGIMEEQVRLEEPTTVEQLCHLIFAEWNQILCKLCEKLMDSMKGCLQAASMLREDILTRDEATSCGGLSNNPTSCTLAGPIKNVKPSVHKFFAHPLLYLVRSCGVASWETFSEQPCG